MNRVVAGNPFRIALLAATALCVMIPIGHNPQCAAAEQPPDARLEQLESTVKQLQQEIETLRKERAQSTERDEGQDKRLAELAAELHQAANADERALDAITGGISFGGYGEMHANFGKDSADVFDIHRLVLYVGYDFADWIRFNSEVEIEHAFVSKSSGGEIGIEQAYVDFLLSDPLAVRVGRILTPIGIINKKHEPPTFNGVERPSVDKYIIPTTWSSDGVGVFGRPSPVFSYEAYVVGGLDGSKFSALNGIRDGRIKERASLRDPAVTGRVDFYPWADEPLPFDQRLRIGFSGYAGGLNNGNNGKDPGIDGSLTVISADAEYSISRFDFRGVIVDERISGARQIGNGTASGILGWYLEGACHVWPDAWKAGRLAKSDAIIFVRYDEFDTQHRMPSGVARNPAGDRNEWTYGGGFYPVPNLVVKADYQVRDDASGSSLDDLLNLGIGWQF